MIRTVRRRNGLYSLYRNGVLIIDNLDFDVAMFIATDLSDAEEELTCFMDDILSDYIVDKVRDAYHRASEDSYDEEVTIDD